MILALPNSPELTFANAMRTVLLLEASFAVAACVIVLIEYARRLIRRRADALTWHVFFISFGVMLATAATGTDVVNNILNDYAFTWTLAMRLLSFASLDCGLLAVLLVLIRRRVTERAMMRRFESERIP